jgi:YebC/PmpR family DNA-binding regulatory protein
MSGHSKWSTIKHQKGAADAKRGALFTKISRELAVAVKNGGGADPNMNFHLRLVLDKAKGANMPQDSISRAVKRGSGEGAEGEVLEEITYEGYGPGGGAILLQALTTNRNRTAADVRSAFNRGGGNLGETGCVAWNFDSLGVIGLEMKDVERGEELSMIAIDAGADDVKLEDEFLEIFTAVDQLQTVQKALESEGVPPDAAQISMVPKTTIALDDKQAQQTLRRRDRLEE